jgi:hypothetical protein
LSDLPFNCKGEVNHVGAAVLVIVVGRLSGLAHSVVALDIDVQILALASSLHVKRAEVPLSVQSVDGVLDSLSEHSLSGLVTKHGAGELHGHLEHSLGWSGS